MATENFYAGPSYSTDPKYNSNFSKGNVYGSSFTGYHIPFQELSSAVDPRTANQLKEASEAFNTGVKHIEVGSVQPDVFESIPKEHFKEMSSMAKLAGADVSFHAPMIDPTGISQQGWDKMSQKAAEDQLWNAIKVSHDLNPTNHVVTIHATSTGLPGAELNLKEGKNIRPVSMIFINESDGKIQQIKEEKKYFGSKDGKPLPFNPKEQLASLNEDVWMQRMSNLNFSAERGRQEIETALDAQERSSGKIPDDVIENRLMHGKLFLREAYRNTRELFDDVYEEASKDSAKKAKLDEYAKKVTAFLDKDTFSNLEKNKDKLREFSSVVEEGVKVLGNITPQIFKPIRDFAIEKSAETTANLAVKGYNEFKDKAPIIALENHPAQQALLTTGEDLRDVVKEAHKKFIEKAILSKDKGGAGLSESEARKQAEKLIGVTWDVGHINMIRKYGYDKEDIIEQTKAVAPYVKKVHLADNFGFEHTELPMGMGNVPIKEIIEKLKDGQEGYGDIKKVIEAGNWWQHFSANSKANGPLMPTISGMGAYVTGDTGWNQMYGVPAAYFSGYGTMLPEQNFQTYGAGFLPLPTELGGQMPQGRDRLSGTPMA